VHRPAPITLLAIGHACVDVYQGSAAALVPFFVAERAYDYAAASGIVVAVSVLSSVTQPVFGAMSDRWRLLWLLPASTAVSGLGIALSGLSGSYGWTLLFIALAGVGIAAYHPISAQLARAASGDSHRAMSWFSLGGNLGFTVAPLVVGAVIGSGGLRLTPLLLAPAAIGVALCLPVTRALRTPTPAPTTRAGVARQSDDWWSFGRVTLAVICRSIVFVGLSTFVALYAQQRVGDTAAGTVAVFGLFAGGAVGTVLGGHLARRWHRVAIVRSSYLGAVVVIALTLLVPGVAVYPFIVLTGVALYIPFSLQVTLAQDYLPRHSGTASGVTLGLTITVGGLFAPLLGALADHSTLRTALVPLVVMPALAWLALRRLLEPDMPRPKKLDQV
jgi:FSR family fosmidomycin resistance protein-like MFS transporter